MEFEASQLLALVRRWWWLLILGPLIGGMVSYSVSARAEPVYSSRVVVQVNAPHADDGFDPRLVQASESLAMTYYQMLWARPVLDPVVASLSLPYGVDELGERITASTIRGTQLIEIRVADSDPQRAADIANAVAASFGRHIASRTVDSESPVRAVVDTQIAVNEQRIEEINQQIADLAQGGEADSAAAGAPLDQLQETLGGLLQTQSDLRARKQAMDLDAAAAQSQVTIASAAEPSATPDAPRPRMKMVFGAAFGMLVSAAVVVVVGYLDKTVKAETDFATLVGAPVIGRVTSPARSEAGQSRLFQLHQPESEMSEAIRLLRANIMFASAWTRIGSLAVCSPEKGDGKSTIVANLALSTAQAGLRTVLIDANLRRPTVHHLFGLPNRYGLSSWLKGARGSWRELAQLTAVPNLRVIPSGPIPANPGDLLSLGRLRYLVETIGDDADLVLIDTPPVLTSSDAVLVAADVDGILLVCQAQRTRLDAVRRAAATLRPGSSRMIGVVLTQQSWRARQEGHYGVRKATATLPNPGPAASARAPHRLEA